MTGSFMQIVSLNRVYIQIVACPIWLDHNVYLNRILNEVEKRLSRSL